MNDNAVASSKSPTLAKLANVQVYDFYDALKMIQDGEKRIASLAWGNSDYILMRDGHLRLHKDDGLHIFDVTDGDFAAVDWVILE